MVNTTLQPFSLHTKFNCSCLQVVSYIPSHLISNSIILERTNLGHSKIGWDRAERPVVDYGQTYLVKRALDDHSCLLLLPELPLSPPSRVHLLPSMKSQEVNLRPPVTELQFCRMCMDLLRCHRIFWTSGSAGGAVV